MSIRHSGHDIPQEFCVSYRVAVGLSASSSGLGLKCSLWHLRSSFVVGYPGMPGRRMDELYTMDWPMSTLQVENCSPGQDVEVEQQRIVQASGLRWASTWMPSSGHGHSEG